MRIIALFFLVSRLVFSADILSVDLSTDFTYSDLDTHCHLQPLGKRFTLAAEFEGQTITHAKFRKIGMMGQKEETIELNDQEMAEIEFQNEKSSLFLTQFLASPRMIAMLFRGGDQEITKCIPKEKLSSLSPESFTFEFAPTLVNGKLPIYSHSNKAIFHGTTESGKAYRIELILDQENY